MLSLAWIARLYFTTCGPSSLPFFAATSLTSSSSSIVSAGASAAGASSSEAAKTASIPIAAAAASATSAAQAAAHQISQEEKDKASVAGLDEEEKNEQDRAAAKDNLREIKLDGGSLFAMILVNRLGEAQSDTCIGGDDLGDLLDAERNCSVVIEVTQGRDHGTANISDLGVVQNALKTVADFDAILPRVHDDQQKNAAVSPLRANLPLVFERSGKLVYRLIAIHRLDRDNRDLGVRLAIDLGTEIFKIELGGRSEDVGKIADIARGSRKRG